MKPFYINVDVKKETYISEPVAVTKNDKVTFILRVTDDELPYDLTGVVRYTLSSYSPGEQPVLTIGEKTGVNEVTFNLGTNEINKPGKVQAAIQLYSSDGRVSSVPFTYKVREDLTDNYILSEVEKTIIEIVLIEGPTVVNQLKDRLEIVDSRLEEDWTGAIGPQGIQGVKGDTGAKGATGPQGPIGLTGPQGVKGDTGATGPQGVKGDTGAKGDQGIQGPQGVKGDIGSTGLQGVKGDTGPIGLTGSQGIKGDTGSTGPQGIQGVKGATGPIGPQGIQGPTGLKGEDGKSFTVDASGTLAQRSQYDSEPLGFSFLDSEYGNLYIRQVSGWSSPIPFGKGETGATGPQGPIGLTGPQGVKGDTGATGPQGVKGTTGATGNVGATGSQGPIGLTGPQGVKGDTGAIGPIGLTGPQGVKGDTGVTGAVGPQGVKGDTGAVGAVGPKGDTGLTGSIGPQGIQGVKGATGNTGLTGPTGPQGPQGIKGDSGASNWTEIGDKPLKFPPEVHKHVISDVEGLQSAIDKKLDNTGENQLDGKLTIIKRDASSYSNSHLELRALDGGDVFLGFHRSGATAVALKHTKAGGDGLHLENSVGQNAAFHAGPIYSNGILIEGGSKFPLSRERPQGVNIDTYLSSGMFPMGGSIVGTLPPITIEWGTLFVLVSGDVITQLGFTMNNEIFMRTRKGASLGAVWSDWKELGGGGDGYVKITEIATTAHQSLISFSPGNAYKHVRLILKDVSHNATSNLNLQLYINGVADPNAYHGNKYMTTSIYSVVNSAILTNVHTSSRNVSGYLDVRIDAGGLISVEGVTTMYVKGSNSYDSMEYHKGALRRIETQGLITLMLAYSTVGYMNSGVIEMWGVPR